MKHLQLIQLKIKKAYGDILEVPDSFNNYTAYAQYCGTAPFIGNNCCNSGFFIGGTCCNGC